MSAVILKDVAKATSLIKKGEVVAFPTETVYGLGAKATSKTAVAKVFTIKKRPRDNPLICHFHSLEQILEYIVDQPKYFEPLVKHFCPGPVSFLVTIPKTSPLLPATCGKLSMVCRIPQNSKALELIRQLGFPIVGPSANTSSKMSGVNVEMIQADLGDRIKAILDDGWSQVGIESTILDCRYPHQIKILRPGSIGKAELEKFVQESTQHIQILEALKPSTQEVVPGSKYKHYSPKAKIIGLKSVAEALSYLKNNSSKDQSLGLLVARQDYLELEKSLEYLQTLKTRVLDIGDTLQPDTIAKKIYFTFYQLDQQAIKTAVLVWPKFGQTSLEKALINRISKAISNTVSK